MNKNTVQCAVHQRSKIMIAVRILIKLTNSSKNLFVFEKTAASNGFKRSSPAFNCSVTYWFFIDSVLNGTQTADRKEIVTFFASGMLPNDEPS